MGLFDKMFGSKASHEPTIQQQFEQLRDKYQPVLTVLQQQGVQLSDMHVDNGKLNIIGTAASQDAKNRVWDQIKLFPNYEQDLMVDIRVPEQAPQTQAAAAAAQGRTQTARSYTVSAGDTLSKISMQFYGNSNEYMKIFNANRDKLSDPDKIFPGQELTIPE